MGVREAPEAAVAMAAMAVETAAAAAEMGCGWPPAASGGGDVRETFPTEPLEESSLAVSSLAGRPTADEVASPSPWHGGGCGVTEVASPSPGYGGGCGVRAERMCASIALRSAGMLPTAMTLRPKPSFVVCAETPTMFPPHCEMTVDRVPRDPDLRDSARLSIHVREGRSGVCVAGAAEERASARAARGSCARTSGAGER